ncbi:glucose 1-dehydrogenase [Marivibrio halodurans]|uniref:Glucose 1-dehydrogenase n=1 Tax=Marivibrio halodurans TaxID=2039722 RepID=A0A8J7S2B4_9PROT|nr:glucose 1-dehydrogenase [Marivibrio halodurans]MBP5855414.1 glucose 1-dehydrogenase [Marivibrio halodurans]
MKGSDLFDLTGKVALVTGASQGLGARFAEVLAENGAAVALAARQTDKLETLKARIEASGGTAHAVALDVTDEASVAAAFDAAEGALGPLDIVINNAGVAISKGLLDVTAEEWDKVLDTNLRGAFLVAQAAGRRMAERGAGSIVNIESVLGYSVMKGVGPYCASKGGLGQLTRVLAAELARFGVRVNGIAPGYIGTDINRDFFATEAGEKLRKSIPFRRVGEPEELDGTLLLLASKAGSYMTGSTVVVDGGFLTR